MTFVWGQEMRFGRPGGNTLPVRFYGLFWEHGFIGVMRQSK